VNVVKLDRRYDGHGFFTHRVEFYGSQSYRIRQWIRARNWLWSQFGPSAEQALARAVFFDGAQPKWAWDSDKSSIYLKEEALVMFQLRKEFWENEQNL
jgi:hypothetical protein